MKFIKKTIYFRNLKEIKKNKLKIISRQRSKKTKSEYNSFGYKAPKVIRTDFKLIGKVESQTNNFYKISVLAHF